MFLSLRMRPLLMNQLPIYPPHPPTGSDPFSTWRDFRGERGRCQ